MSSIENLTDEALKEAYYNIELDSASANHPIIKEMKKRGLIEPDEPTDTFKSIESL